MKTFSCLIKLKITAVTGMGVITVKAAAAMVKKHPTPTLPHVCDHSQEMRAQGQLTHKFNCSVLSQIERRGCVRVIVHVHKSYLLYISCFFPI